MKNLVTSAGSHRRSIGLPITRVSIANIQCKSALHGVKRHFFFVPHVFFLISVINISIINIINISIIIIINIIIIISLYH